MRYINKNVFIDAIQFNGKNLPDIEEFIEYSNIISVNIINNVLYINSNTYEKAEIQTLSVLPNEYLIKDASGYITILEEDILKIGWIPFNFSK